jgi:signal transduction histidine kinase
VSNLAYSLLIILRRFGILLTPSILMPNGASQAFILSLPYLAFISLLIWAMATEREQDEERLSISNQELRRINAKLRSLVMAGEETLSSLDKQQLLDAAVLQVTAVTGYTRVAIYVREGDSLILSRQHDLSSAFEMQRSRRVLSDVWLAMTGAESAITQESLGEKEGILLATPGHPRLRILTHVALRSPHGIEGMLTLPSSMEEPLDQAEAQVLQILGHQLGIALENARLFENLQNERNTLGNILAHMAEGVVVVDHAGVILLRNLAARRLFGVEEGEQLPAWFCEKIEAEEGALRGERRNIAFDDKIISLSVSELSGRKEMPVSTIYVARDITQEAQVERMKSDFVAYASHELRTPLTTIKMMVGLLLMDTPEETKSHEYLSVINTQLERQTRMINNLLDLARLEAGRYELAEEEVQPQQIIRSVVSACRPLVEKKGLTIESSCSESLGSFMSNGTGLEQVLMNLLSNAIKFTDSGGHIEVSCRKQGDEMLLTVEDSGIGMTQEQLGRIFTKFYTVRNPSKRGEGTGLGLAISKLIVDKLGGDIEVTSTPRHGSCFTVCLPAGKGIQ